MTAGKLCQWQGCDKEIEPSRIAYAEKMGWNVPKFCFFHSKQNSANYRCQQNGEPAKFPMQKV